jgi:two-component system, response regulator
MNNVDILHIEDDPGCIELVQRALKRNLFSVDLLQVSDGHEALQFISTHINPPKLILLDLKLPKISGLRVLAELKSNEKTRMLPVVIFTSSKETNDIAESYLKGANSYIIKPLEYKEFLTVMDDIMKYWFKLNQPQT